MENYCNFKPFDKVLVRYDNQHVWQIIHTSKTSKGGMVKLSNAIHTKFV